MRFVLEPSGAGALLPFIAERPPPPLNVSIVPNIMKTTGRRSTLTTSIFIKKGEQLLEFRDFFLGELVSQERLIWWWRWSGCGRRAYEVSARTKINKNNNAGGTAKVRWIAAHCTYTAQTTSHATCYPPPPAPPKLEHIKLTSGDE